MSSASMFQRPRIVLTLVVMMMISFALVSGASQRSAAASEDADIGAILTSEADEEPIKVRGHDHLSQFQPAAGESETKTETGRIETEVEVDATGVKEDKNSQQHSEEEMKRALDAYRKFEENFARGSVILLAVFVVTCVIFWNHF